MPKSAAVMLMMVIYIEFIVARVKEHQVLAKECQVLQQVELAILSIHHTKTASSHTTMKINFMTCRETIQVQQKRTRESCFNARSKWSSLNRDCCHRCQVPRINIWTSSFSTPGRVEFTTHMQPRLMNKSWPQKNEINGLTTCLFWSRLVDQLKKGKTPGMVHRITCRYCDYVYINESSNFEKHLMQHMSNVKKKNIAPNAMAEHMVASNHDIWLQQHFRNDQRKVNKFHGSISSSRLSRLQEKWWMITMALFCLGWVYKFFTSCLGWVLKCT